MARAKRHYIPGHLWHITYIDMNMVRAGVVAHPSEWKFCGYNEIQNPHQRKGIIDYDRLIDLLGFEGYATLKNAHGKWVKAAISSSKISKEDKWTQSIAVGSKPFIKSMPLSSAN